MTFTHQSEGSHKQAVNKIIQIARECIQRTYLIRRASEAISEGKKGETKRVASNQMRREFPANFHNRMRR